jgi:hypothetical protein
LLRVRRDLLRQGKRKGWRPVRDAAITTTSAHAVGKPARGDDVRKAL